MRMHFKSCSSYYMSTCSFFLFFGPFCSLPRDTQPGLLRAKIGSKKLIDLGLQFIPMEQIIKDAVESLKSKGFIS